MRVSFWFLLKFVDTYCGARKTSVRLAFVEDVTLRLDEKPDIKSYARSTPFFFDRQPANGHIFEINSCKHSDMLLFNMIHTPIKSFIRLARG
jgi:hypothetical protein